MSEKTPRYREKPKINREKLRREDRIRQCCAQSTEQAVRLLQEEECLGEPFREGPFIVIPVHAVDQDEAAYAKEQKALRALVSAWLDAPPAP